MNEERASSLLLLAEQAAQQSRSPDATAWFDRLEGEHEYVLEALQWFIDREEADKALRLGVGLYPFWHGRGYLREGLEWLQKLLAMPGGSAELRAKVLHRAGMLAFRSGDESVARNNFEESLRLARQLGDKTQTASTLLGLGRLVALRQGDYMAGHRLFEESLMLARELGERRAEGEAIHCLAALARLEGDVKKAVGLYQASLSLRRELGDKGGVAMEQLNLGFMTLHQGDADGASKLFAESLRSSHERGDKYVMPADLVGLAGVAVRSGDAVRASRLLGAADFVLEGAGLILDPDDRIEYDQIASAVRTQLGDEVMEANWTEGHEMKTEKAIDYALQAPSGDAQRSGR